MAINNKPATTLQRGIVKATIWENASKNGLFFSTTLVGHIRNDRANGATVLRLV